MLIVRRRSGQAILIGDQVEIQVLEITPGRVKLGVMAPREISVLRAEVKLTREANLAAAQAVCPEKLAELSNRLRSAGSAQACTKPPDRATERPQGACDPS